MFHFREYENQPDITNNVESPNDESNLVVDSTSPMEGESLPPISIQSLETPNPMAMNWNPYVLLVFLVLGPGAQSGCVATFNAGMERFSGPSDVIKVKDTSSDLIGRIAQRAKDRDAIRTDRKLSRDAVIENSSMTEVAVITYTNDLQVLKRCSC